MSFGSYTSIGVLQVQYFAPTRSDSSGHNRGDNVRAGGINAVKVGEVLALITELLYSGG